MKNHLVLGDWNAICDCCGFKFKASQLRKRWDGLYVCSTDFETRHPQDMLRVKPESTTIPFSRPEGDLFIDRPSCTIPGLTAIPGYAIPGCSIPARAGPTQ